MEHDRAHSRTGFQPAARAQRLTPVYAGTGQVRPAAPSRPAPTVTDVQTAPPPARPAHASPQPVPPVPAPVQPAQHHPTPVSHQTPHSVVPQDQPVVSIRITLPQFSGHGLKTLLAWRPTARQVLIAIGVLFIFTVGYQMGRQSAKVTPPQAAYAPLSASREA